jgi:hypothetical protein
MPIHTSPPQTNKGHLLSQAAPGSGLATGTPHNTHNHQITRQGASALCTEKVRPATGYCQPPEANADRLTVTEMALPERALPVARVTCAPVYRPSKPLSHPGCTLLSIRFPSAALAAQLGAW